MKIKQHVAWKQAVSSELDSMEKKAVWALVDKPTKMSDGSTLYLIDSRWVFKRNEVEGAKPKFKARLVICRFKDRNVYELSETYAPV